MRYQRLVYVSVAADRLDRSDLQAIGVTARTMNSRHGVTGILLHVSDEFFQVLEGPQTAVETLFENICEDPRNRCVTPLLRERLVFRAFSTWSMGCFNVDFENLPKSVFFRADWAAVKLRAHVRNTRTFHGFLQRFYDVNQTAAGADGFRRAAAVQAI